MKIGIDIVDLEKFKNSLLSSGDTMKWKIFTYEEISSVKEVSKLAGIFAAKEAFIKAYSKKKFMMNEIEIKNDKSGKPILYKPTIVLKNCEVELSIAHDGNYVIAVCVIF
jgi:phosphopantetheine--protein transferase-like protein